MSRFQIKKVDDYNNQLCLFYVIYNIVSYYYFFNLTQIFSTQLISYLNI